MNTQGNSPFFKGGPRIQEIEAEHPDHSRRRTPLSWVVLLGLLLLWVVLLSFLLLLRGAAFLLLLWVGLLFPCLLFGFLLWGVAVFSPPFAWCGWRCWVSSFF